MFNYLEHRQECCCLKNQIPALVLRFSAVPPNTNKHSFKGIFNPSCFDGGSSHHIKKVKKYSGMINSGRKTCKFAVSEPGSSRPSNWWQGIFGDQRNIPEVDKDEHWTWVARLPCHSALAKAGPPAIALVTVDGCLVPKLRAKAGVLRRSDDSSSRRLASDQNTRRSTCLCASP